MFDFSTPISFIWLALSIVGALIVLWIFLFLISITLPLLYGYQGYIRKVRLQLFLGLYMGKNSLQPTVGGDYVGLNRIASALRMAIPNIDRDTFDKYVLFLTKAGDLHQQPQILPRRHDDRPTRGMVDGPARALPASAALRFGGHEVAAGEREADRHPLHADRWHVRARRYQIDLAFRMLDRMDQSRHSSEP